MHLELFSAAPARAALVRALAAALLFSLSSSGLAAESSASEYAPATSHGRPNFDAMECGDGAFFDPRNGGECWSCGDAQRSVLAVDTDKACVEEPFEYARATRLERDKLRCSGAAFFDIGSGECWTCPKGFRRSAAGVLNVTSDKACLRKTPGDEKKAIFDHDTGSVLRKCKKGTFANVGSTRCHRCPSGYSHNPLKKVQQKGVCFQEDEKIEKPARKVGKPSGTKCDRGFFDLIDGGSCWECPADHARFFGAVDGDRACVTVAGPLFSSAEFKRSAPLDRDALRSGAARLGCGQYGRDAFFDLIDGGSCWECPASHPTRTIYAVDSGRACATDSCGSAGGRPCYVWERFPSCDPGLAEDPIENQCVQPKDLACDAFLGTLAGLKRAIEQAKAAGEVLQEEAIERIPGARQTLRFVENQNEQVEKQAGKLIARADFSAVTGELEELIIENQAFVGRMADAATILHDSKTAVEQLLLDPEIVCRGDAQAANQRLRELGIPAALGLDGSGGGGSTLVSDAGSSPHAMSFDLGIEVPVKGAHVSLGIQFVTDFGDQAAFAIMHGVKKKFELETDPTKLFSVGLTLGWVYSGNPDPCAIGNYSFGVPVGFSGFLGIGFGCAGFTGLGVQIVGADYSSMKSIVPGPAGPVPVPTPGGWKLSLPEPSIEGAVGYEGAIKISPGDGVRPGIL